MKNREIKKGRKLIAVFALGFGLLTVFACGLKLAA
jgi:hypothetical protein